MRMLLKAGFPVEPFNTFVRDGSVGSRIGRVLEDIKPQATYFTEENGRRTALMIVDVADASKVPAIAEPLYLTFNAEVTWHIAMTPEDLGKAGLDAVGKRYAR